MSRDLTHPTRSVPLIPRLAEVWPIYWIQLIKINSYTGPATNHCPENGLSHLWTMECPNVLIIALEVVAPSFYANEYLLISKEHYERIPNNQKISTQAEVPKVVWRVQSRFSNSCRDNDVKFYKILDNIGVVNNKRSSTQPCAEMRCRFIVIREWEIP